MLYLSLLQTIISKDYMVPEAGLEPAHLAAGDFESPASTNSATRATLSSIICTLIDGQHSITFITNLYIYQINCIC